MNKKFSFKIEGLFRLTGVIQISEYGDYSCNPSVVVDNSLDMKSEQFANIISIVKTVISAHIDNILKTMRKDGNITEKKPIYIS